MSRITFGMISANVQTGLQANSSRVNESMGLLSTGKRIDRPSTDSVGASSALQLRTQLSGNNQYLRNMEDGLGWLTTAENSLGSGNSVIQRVRELAIQGANDTYSAQDRVAMRNEISSLTQQMLTIMSSTFRGQYIFSGTHAEEPPFTQRTGHDSITGAANTNGISLSAVPATVQIWDTTVKDGNTPTGNVPVRDILPGSFTIPGLTEGTDFNVDYVQGQVTFTSAASLALAGGAGPNIQASYDWIRRSDKDITGAMNREIQQGIVVPINVSANAAVGKASEVSLFDSMVAVMQGLHTNQVAQVKGSLTNLDLSMNRLLNAQTLLGTQANRFETTTDQNRQANVNLTQQSSQIEDVDFAQVISEFQNRQQVYQASLQVGAKIIQPSLMDFL